MASFVRRMGCCTSGPALGDMAEDAGMSTAIQTPAGGFVDPRQMTPWRGLFAVSVGAGLTVWALTKLLSKQR